MDIKQLRSFSVFGTPSNLGLKKTENIGSKNEVKFDQYFQGYFQA